MRTMYRTSRPWKQSLLFISLLGLALAFTLAACGSNGSTGSSPAPTPTTIVKGYGTAYGCPSDVVVSTPPSAANVLVKPSDTRNTIIAYNGNVIEVRLPFGEMWAGPKTSAGVLELQAPSGYAWKADKVCVWRFIAKGTGTTELNFTGRAICKPGQLCPQYIVDMPFIINVK